jgi:hypothetical protein
MKTDVVARDCRIVGQLAERAFTDAFTMSSPQANDDLRPRVDELGSWLNLVDNALIVRTCSSWRLSLRGGSNVAIPQFQQPVVRCLGRAPLRFYPWPDWPLPYAATALPPISVVVPTFRLASVFGLHPPAVASHTWQLRTQGRGQIGNAHLLEVSENRSL